MSTESTESQSLYSIEASLEPLTAEIMKNVPLIGSFVWVNRGDFYRYAILITTLTSWVSPFREVRTRVTTCCGSCHKCTQTY